MAKNELKYRDTYPGIARALYSKGWIDAEVAEAFGVTRATVYNWRANYPEFDEACESSKIQANTIVERSLFERATGAKWTETTAIKLKRSTFDAAGRKCAEEEYVELVEVQKGAPPDTTASIFWLTNRSNDEWKHRAQLEHVVSGGLMFDVTEPAENQPLMLESGESPSEG